MDIARVIPVIETTLLRRGDGSEADPMRIVTQYWSVDGEFLAERDPVVKEMADHFNKLNEFASGEITDLKDNVATKARHIGEQAAEIDRLRAQLHGMQDGSLVRDLAAHCGAGIGELEEQIKISR